MFFDELEVDFGINEGEDDCADYIKRPVEISEDATGTSQGDPDYHQNFENNAGDAVFNVFRKDDGDDEEDRRNN